MTLKIAAQLNLFSKNAVYWSLPLFKKLLTKRKSQLLWEILLCLKLPNSSHPLLWDLLTSITEKNRLFSTNLRPPHSGMATLLSRKILSRKTQILISPEMVRENSEIIILTPIWWFNMVLELCAEEPWPHLALNPDLDSLMTLSIISSRYLFIIKFKYQIYFSQTTGITEWIFSQSIFLEDVIMGLLLTIKSRLNSAKLTQLTVNTTKDGQVCCPAGTNLYEVATITDNGRYVYKLIYFSSNFIFFDINFLII